SKRLERSDRLLRARLFVARTCCLSKIGVSPVPFAPMALAYFITFSTYGTWLHGTEKGKGSVDRDHNGYATPFLEPDVNRQSDEKNAMVQPPYLLDEARRVVVRHAIVALAKEKQ